MNTTKGWEIESEDITLKMMDKSKQETVGASKSPSYRVRLSKRLVPDAKWSKYEEDW